MKITKLESGYQIGHKEKDPIASGVWSTTRPVWMSTTCLFTKNYFLEL